jgi:hypothetical protein
MLLLALGESFRWRELHPEEQKQILRDAYPIARCATGLQACVAQDDRDCGKTHALPRMTGPCGERRRTAGNDISAQTRYERDFSETGLILHMYASAINSNAFADTESELE